MKYLLVGYRFYSMGCSTLSISLDLKGNSRQNYHVHWQSSIYYAFFTA